MSRYLETPYNKSITARIVSSPALYIILIIIVTLLVINIQYPYVGFDHRYYVPRILDSYLFYLKNGLAIQWWTPSFGGGIPSYPNPNQLQFSLPQFILFIFPPWISFNISVAVFYAAGYYGTFLILREMSISKEDAILGATLFSVNAFYLHRVAVGHWSFLVFPLLPLVVYLFVNKRIPVLISSVGVALSLSYMIYSAGFYLIITYFFSIPLTILTIYLLTDRITPDYRRMVKITSISMPLALLSAGSKILAVQSFMRHFPRLVTETYDVGVIKAVSGMLAQLFLTPLLSPLLTFFGMVFWYPQTLIRKLTGATYTLCDLDTGMSPVSAAILLAGVALVLWEVIGKRREVRFKKPFLLICLVFMTWLAIEIILARGIVYPFLKPLPFFKSLRANFRYTAIFILPLALLSIHLLRHLRDVMRRRFSRDLKLALPLALLAIVIFAGYIRVPGLYCLSTTDMRRLNDDYFSIKSSYEGYRIKEVREVEDFEVFDTMSSSLKIYEPLFWEADLEVRAGAVDETEGGYFNITNPVSLVFPEEKGLRVFERVSTDDAENFRKFVNYEKTSWKIPAFQGAVNLISFFTSALSFLTLISYAAYRLLGHFRDGRVI